MYRFLLTRQWVILTLLGLVLIPVMIKLGFWQYHRHQHKVAQNAQIEHNVHATPVPVTELAAVGRTLPHGDMWRQVTATGSYDTAHEVVVRQRTAADEQSIGYYVLTPLVLGNGDAVLVNRGWIAAGNDLTKFPRVPAAPKGTVTVTGRMMADETTAASGIKDTRGLPPRQVMLINSTEQAKRVGRPMLGGYIEQTAPKSDTPEQVPEPDYSSIGPHMAYAIQWWLFAAAVPVGWVVLVRRERRDRLAAAAKEAEGAGAAEPAEPADAAPAEAKTAEAAEAAAADAEPVARTAVAPD
ncbi:SURF1 family protein [Streptomyces noursei]|uniref:SURF1 family cytochrome oxidase biogenesis protein n=1 Tax=Streptomyces noursei TaxID=1971 RepID=UPI0033D0CF65